MQLINHYITNNPYYKDGKWITGSDFKGFFLHSVGCSQPDPMVFIRNWDKSSYTNAGINGFIGAEEVYITAPCLETKGKVKRMPHAGKPAGNNGYIGFEMCEPACIHYTSGANFTCSDLATARAFVTKTYNNAVELFAKLCTFHGKDPLADGVIVSHAEGYKRGIATDHADPEHLWRGLGMGNTMDAFRQAVKAAMAGVKAGQIYRVRKSWDDPRSQIAAYRNLTSAKAECLPGYKVFDEAGNVVYDPAQDKKEETSMTKEEILALIDARLEVKLAGKGTKPHDYLEEEFEQAKAAGITDGARPLGYATREEVAAMVLRATKK